MQEFAGGPPRRDPYADRRTGQRRNGDLSTNMTTVILATIALVGSISTGVVTVLTYQQASEAKQQSERNSEAIKDAKVEVVAAKKVVDDTAVKVEETKTTAEATKTAAEAAQVTASGTHAALRTRLERQEADLKRRNADLQQKIQQAESLAQELTEALRRLPPSSKRGAP